MGSVRGEVGGAEKGACGLRSRRACARVCSAGAVGGEDEWLPRCSVGSPVDLAGRGSQRIAVMIAAVAARLT
jgi:hypothetical protein